MIELACPHCSCMLQVDAAYAGKNVQCTRCKGVFIAPEEYDNKNSVETIGSIPFPILLLILLAGHIVGLLFLGMIIGIGRSTALVVMLVLIEIAIWQRQSLIVWFQQLWESDTAKRVVERGREQVANVFNPPQTASRSFAKSEKLVDAEVVDTRDDILVEIQVGGTLYPLRETIPSPWGNRRSYDSGNGKPLAVNLPKDRVVFFGPGTSIDLGRGKIQDPLVYATGAACGNRFGASLIDATLPVAPPNQSLVEDLPYWPSYYESNSEQRSRYLDWLTSGRCDAQVELGYVFIFFYGLERRILVDDADHLPVIEEIVRLCSIYNHSNSFRNYSSALLWMAVLLAGREKPIAEMFISPAIMATERWNENTLGMCLAYYCQHELALPEEVAFIVAHNDSRSRSSVIVKRHRKEFQELFNKKYHAQYGNGMMLKASKRPKKVSYHPASASLHRDYENDKICSLKTMPNVLGISSQFKPLIAIWEECIEDLRAYSRANRIADGGQLTAEAYEALPGELQDGNHPEENTWMDLWQEYADEDGWPLVPVSRFAGLKGIGQRDRLTKAQSAKILKTADAMGIGLEPDARLTGRPYRWNERISPFFLESDDPEDMTSYHAAAVLLRLGMSVSAADGQIDQEELELITEHLEAQFDLSVNQSKRLEQLKYLLMNSQDADNTVSSVLRKRLPHDHRVIVGKFLVGIAAADQVITREEVKALKAAYRALGLEASELDELLAPHAAVDPKKAKPSKVEPDSSEFVLDMDAVSKIMGETKKVARILGDVFAEEDDATMSCRDEYASAPTDSEYQAANESAAATATLEPEEAQSELDSNESPKTISDLSERFQPFFHSLIRRNSWTQHEAAELAREHGVMLSGAIEVINEWSQEHFDDWLIEENDGLIVQVDLIEGNT